MATCHADNVELYNKYRVCLIVGVAGDSPDKLNFCRRHNNCTIVTESLF
jgi:hypothetical protein